MIQTQAEQIVMQFMKLLFGFTRNRCATMEDAEDVSQEICIKLYRALLFRDDITEPEKFAWTIAHNVLANYYRGRSRRAGNIPIYGLADAFNLPLGTVKWYLFEAKNELQKGLGKMRTSSSGLKFNPITFNRISTNGSAGSMGGNGVYLRSVLAQNILFLTRNEAMAINDIADMLGVSPVYI